HDRNVQRNGAGDVGADVDLGRQDVGQAGLEQDVVKREGFADRVMPVAGTAWGRGHCQLLSAARCREISWDERRLRLYLSALPSNRSPSVGLTLVDSMAERRIKGFGCHAQLFVTGR